MGSTGEIERFVPAKPCQFLAIDCKWCAPSCLPSSRGAGWSNHGSRTSRSFPGNPTVRSVLQFDIARSLLLARLSQLPYPSSIVTPVGIRQAEAQLASTIERPPDFGVGYSRNVTPLAVTNVAETQSRLKSTAAISCRHYARLRG